MIRNWKVSVSGDNKLSDHFKVKEFACKDGSDYLVIDEFLITILELVRQKIGKPIKIVSGYRTEGYNKQCGGAKDSYHCKGMAADIRCDGITPTTLAIYAAMYGATGIGVYDDFVHIDTRNVKLVFR